MVNANVSSKLAWKEERDLGRKTYSVEVSDELIEAEDVFASDVA